MAIRIERIKVNRGGPLNRDFELEPRDLNLIYGNNETGKTYIVESIINLLFETGRRSVVCWNLREWVLSGRIVVSGLKDSHVTFTNTSRKLDDYWKEESGLPQDLSRLLVVKAGETILAQEKDGVGRNILKDYLSGEGLLDRIDERISSTLKEATIQHGLINGANRGEIRNRTQLKEELDKIDVLLKDVEQEYASGEVCSLRQKKEKIETELNMLKKAKRHHVACLHKDKKDLETEREKLPVEEELSEIESEITIYETKKAEVERKSVTLKELESFSENYKWTMNALSDYEKIVSGQVFRAPRRIFMLVALALLVVTLLSGLLGYSTPLILFAIGSMVFSVLYYVETRNAIARASYSRELEDLKVGFKNRFGLELNDKAQLKAKADELQEDHIRASDLKKDLDGRLIPEINTRERSIKTTLNELTSTELSPQEWRENVSALRRNIKRLENEISSLDKDLASLAVREVDYLDLDPGIKWDSHSYEVTEHKLGEAEELLKDAMNKLERLKNRIIQETGMENTEWECLITALQNKREEKAQEYRRLTAEILAKIQVNTVIREFRQKENIRIEEGLMSEELTKPLYLLTGRYKGLKLQEDRGLTLITDSDEVYPLSAISTGAKEQAFLALRIGFASITMKGHTAFLILDDAFQHSDWQRRTNLINQILDLVSAGWQAFYFTMDDHIKDLFHREGQQLGDRFTELELS